LRAPHPTERGARGGQVLAPRFVEWMMGLEPGHVTDTPGLSRPAQLELLGNGVVPQQAEYSIRHLVGVLSR
jgi:DNA (cytosine-5)-methyltransferase 1